ncbi:transcription initiation factor TFIID subunit 9-like [Lolium rigidum]|uniref:transcription initiation factor TFIID subunit 9-like n=1 Tax=Lolium rigidum TaxID=89674 RepID=UPI001F5E22B9|nr:transcription initiation factor TFIID subunit 9-like [Lolium rigidum]
MDPRAVQTPLPPAADAGDEPRDTRVVKEILHSLGLKEGDYEPAVVQQFLILAYRYAGGVLVDALAYADHAGRGATLDADDVRLAILSNATFFPQLPSREAIIEMARSRNTTPLPKYNTPLGSISLPPDQDMLLRPNDQWLYHLKPSDNVEETKNKDDDEICNPEATRNNEEKNGSDKQQFSKRISAKLNAMAARASRRRILNTRKSKKVQPLI